MSFLDYILIFTAAVGYAGLGRLSLPDRDPGRQFLAGLVPVGGVVAVLAAVAPAAIRPFLIVSVAAGWLVVGRDVVRQITGRTAAQYGCTWREVMGAVVATAAFATLLGGLHYRFYDYSNPEEFPYIAPVVEMFLADYSGPLRIPTYYPAIMGAAHFVSFGVLAALCGLLPKVATPEVIEARYLLAVLVLARFFYLAWRNLSVPSWIFLPVSAAILYLFQTEAIVYCIRSSTFLYFFVLLEVCLIVLIDRRPDQPAGDVAAALFFSVALVMTKFVIIYLPAMLALYYLARFREHRCSYATLVIGTIVVANIVATALLPKPFPDLNLQFSLVNPITYIPTIDYYSKYGDGLIWKIGQVGGFLGVPLVFFLAALKYYAVPVAAVDALSAARSFQDERKKLVRGIEIFLLTALLGWILVRNSQHGLTHQAWILYVSSAVAIPSVLVAALTEAGFRWKFGLALAVLIYAGAGVNPVARVPTLFGPHHGDGSMTYASLRRLTPAEALTWNPGEPPVNVGMRAMFFGVRLYANQVPAEYSGSLRAFIGATR